MVGFGFSISIVCEHFLFFSTIAYISHSQKKASRYARGLGLAVVELSQYGAAGCGLLICEALGRFWRVGRQQPYCVGRNDELMYINVYCWG